MRTRTPPLSPAFSPASSPESSPGPSPGPSPAPTVPGARDGRRLLRWTTVALWCAAGVQLGCIGPRQEPAQLLSSRDFTAPGAAATQADGPSDRRTRLRTEDGTFERRPSAAPPPVVFTTGPDAARDGIRDIRATAGRPTPAPDAQPIGEEAFIDAKVGDVNGRPIFASAFLEPLDARIAAEAEQDSPVVWARNTYQLLFNELKEIVQDELIKAEARASLTEEQRFGLAYFLNEQLNRRIRASGGSRTAAQRALNRTGEAETLDEWLQQQEDESLVVYFLRERVRDRVSVSRRQIDLEYERRLDEFNPPPKADLRLIQVSAANEAGIAEITARLAAGEDFAEVAQAEANGFRRPQGGAISRTLEPEGEPTEFFNTARFPNLNEATAALTEGEAAGPIRDGEGGSERVSWVLLEKINRDSVSWYEAQELIEAELRSNLQWEETARFLARLMERASFTSIPEMADRLMDIVVDRHRPELTGRWRPIVGRPSEASGG